LEEVSVWSKQNSVRRRPSRRARIRRALTDLCFEQSYRATTLPALLERAEVSERDFRREFDDLDDCLCSILVEQRSELMAVAWNSFSGHEQWVDQMRALGLAMLRFAQEDPARARTILVEAELAGEPSRLIRDQGMEMFSAFIDTGREQLSDPESVSTKTAYALGGAIFYQVRAKVEKNEFDQLTDHFPEMMYSIVLPYLGPEAALRELAIPPGAQHPPDEPSEAADRPLRDAARHARRPPDGEPS
jgi:AcrR family transcriptional regulator